MVRRLRQYVRRRAAVSIAILRLALSNLMRGPSQYPPAFQRSKRSGRSQDDTNQILIERHFTSKAD